MNPTCLASRVQAAGGVIAWGMFSWRTLGLLILIEHGLHASARLSIVADYMHPVMATIYPSCGNGYFHHDNAPCHKVVSYWFHEHDNEFIL